jgi:hypothetical protein
MWIPSITKIVDFGLAWLNSMAIPELSDFVLGENDPGATPIAIGSMGSASGQVFAYIENNLQYLHDIMVIDDVTINVGTVSELQAALDILDRVIYVHKDKVFAINIAAGTYAWPVPGTEPRSALHVYGVHGAGSVTFGVTGVTIEGNSTTSRPLASVTDCTANVVFSGAVILSNDLNGGTRGAAFDNVRQITALDIEVKNKASGDTLESAIYCREVDHAELGLTVNALAGPSTGINRAIFARQNSRVYFDTGDLTVGKLTSEIFQLEKNSFVYFENLDSCLPTGADSVFLTQSVVLDGSSGVRASDISSSGLGTSVSPYVITVAWESATDTPVLINRIIELLPQPLNVYVKLKLPANTMTSYIAILDLHGQGELELEGNTTFAVQSTTQDTIFDVATRAIEIRRCQLRIKLDSLKLDGDATAGVTVSGSRRVSVVFSYLMSATGGSAFVASGVDCNLFIEGCKVDTCNLHGIDASDGANVRCLDSSPVGPGNDPLQYGNYAIDSASIYRSNTGGKYITGSVASDFTNEGGQVFNS